MDAQTTFWIVWPEWLQHSKHCLSWNITSNTSSSQFDKKNKFLNNYPYFDMCVENPNMLLYTHCTVRLISDVWQSSKLSVTWLSQHCGLLLPSFWKRYDEQQLPVLFLNYHVHHIPGFLICFISTCLQFLRIFYLNNNNLQSGMYFLVEEIL